MILSFGFIYGWRWQPHIKGGVNCFTHWQELVWSGPFLLLNVLFKYFLRQGFYPFLPGSVYNLHPHVWGSHSVLDFTIQISKENSIGTAKNGSKICVCNDWLEHTIFGSCWLFREEVGGRLRPGDQKTKVKNYFSSLPGRIKRLVCQIACFSLA